MHTGKIEWFQRMDKKLGNASEFSVDGLTKLPRVDIIYAHANMSADLIDAAVANGAKGIVVAGVGDGNMTHAALDALAKAAKNGVVVVRSTRLPTGLGAAQQRGERRQDGLRRLGRAQPGQVARAAAAGADEDEGPGADPEDVRRVLRLGKAEPREIAMRGRGGVQSGRWRRRPQPRTPPSPRRSQLEGPRCTPALTLRRATETGRRSP